MPAVDAAVACGVEQHVVLPAVAFLALGLVVYIWYVTVTVAHRAAGHEWLRRRGSQLLSDARASEGASRASVPAEKRVAPSVLGSLQGAAEDHEMLAAARAVARAMSEDCVLLVNLSGYLAARAHVHAASRLFAGACLIAAACSSGTDLAYGTSRLLLLALAWTDHFHRTAALDRGSGAAISERAVMNARSTSMSGRSSVSQAQSRRLTSATHLIAPSVMEHKPDTSNGQGADAISVLRCLLPPSPLAQAWRKGRVVILHLGAAAALAWFAWIRQPYLQSLACPDDNPAVAVGAAQSLIAERGAAMSLLFVWLLMALSHLTILRCEACVWLGPRAEELLAEHLQADRGMVLGGRAIDLAEALCGPQPVADALLHELRDDFGVVVLNGCSQFLLPPARVEEGLLPVTLRDMAELRQEVAAELQRRGDANEVQLSGVLQAVEAVLHCLERREKRPSALELPGFEVKQARRSHASNARKSAAAKPPLEPSPTVNAKPPSRDSLPAPPTDESSQESDRGDGAQEQGPQEPMAPARPRPLRASVQDAHLRVKSAMPPVLEQGAAAQGHATFGDVQLAQPIADDRFPSFEDAASWPESVTPGEARPKSAMPEPRATPGTFRGSGLGAGRLSQAAPVPSSMQRGGMRAALPPLLQTAADPEEPLGF